MTSIDITPDCSRVAAPTLIVTGERDLDFVVPAEGSIAYRHLIPGAQSVVLERTGHIGSITRPAAFADIVAQFTADCGARTGDQSSIAPPAAFRLPHFQGPDAA